MAKRKLLDIERKIIERDVRDLRERKDCITQIYVRDIQNINKAIKENEEMLRDGTIEES